MKNLFSIQGIVSLLFGIFVLTGCNSADPAAQKIYKEASMIHNEAVTIENTVKEKIASLDEVMAQLSTQIEATTDSVAAAPLQAIATELTGLKDSYGLWAGSVIEVPGQEHDHDHGHDHEGHDHSHDHDNAGMDMSPEDMLELQKELKTKIQEIDGNLTTALDKAKAALK